MPWLGCRAGGVALWVRRGVPVYARDVRDRASTESAALHVGQARQLLPGSAAGARVCADGVRAARLLTPRRHASRGDLEATFLGAVFVFRNISGKRFNYRRCSYADADAAAKVEIRRAVICMQPTAGRILTRSCSCAHWRQPWIQGHETGGAVSVDDVGLRHPMLFGGLAAFLASFSVFLQVRACWFSPGVCKVAGAGASDGSKSVEAGAQWRYIWEYCGAVSLPNTAGGIVRSLLGVRLLEVRSSESTAFFSNTHAVAQRVAMLAVMCVSGRIADSNRNWWRLLLVQANLWCGPAVRWVCSRRLRSTYPCCTLCSGRQKRVPNLQHRIVGWSM